MEMYNWVVRLFSHKLGLDFKIKSAKLNLHYARGSTPKRATRGGSISAAKAPGQHFVAPKKCSGSGEPLETVSDFIRSAAPITMSFNYNAHRPVGLDS